ncbi:MAG: DUF1289 domain-containing protein [Henriciella sp.]|nr:DUF1289 domain-containing protein [Henriciella sp.]
MSKIPTPCIGVCSTALGSRVCRGCKRHADEVIHWVGYSESEKRYIDDRLTQHLVKCVRQHLIVTNAELLQKQLNVQRVRHRAEQPPEVWLFALLKAGAGQIQDMSQFGFCHVDPAFKPDLREVREQIDAAWLTLAEAHYDRYYALGEVAPA